LAKDKTDELIKKQVEEINKTAEVNESYLIGLLWSDPFENYTEYSEVLNQDEFIHDVWGFFFEFGRRMFKDGVNKFDEITVKMKLKEYNIEEEFNSYNGFSTIHDVVDIVQHYKDNIEYYYETVKKNYVVRQLFLLFGKKVLLASGKYDWKKMNREQLVKYWNDKLNNISMNNVSTYDIENLYIEADEFIERLEKDASDMLPYYNSKLLNTISQGTPRGHVTMIGGFGGSGKSSITASKFIMSCIENKERTIVVLNEEDAQAFRQKIVLTILYYEFSTGIDRKRMVNGSLDEKDKVKIRHAFKRMKELMDGEDALIKVLFMERYVMKDLEKIVRFWANRGYDNLLIDTHKPSDDSEHDSRWETFTEDMKTIYRWTRKNAGGMNLRTVVTFQLADTAVRYRYLDFEAIGEGKKAKNEASIMYMFRTAWADEYEGGKRELDCYTLKKMPNGEYGKVPFKLESGKTYYLWFTPKNRFGQANDTGLPVLIVEPMFNANVFKEIGWCYVANDKSGR
jgi:replicative DNA helicase